ncbi:hypothetical protein [Paraglaciecola sp. L1A13]|uniref:hypothetical protein n=1 Tax=Paraglaciecola sp. L1A13 TaxID=2686359 RepID=UPI00131CC800|nr:hypothetical protein [Paraglaciecola sp. L1A13]
MRKNEASEERERSIFNNLVVVVVFTSLILGFIFYFNESSPNIRKIALQNLVEQFGKTTLNAHWQWQNEGRPSSILLIEYGAQGDEIGRHPLAMTHLGWPRLEPTSKGCAVLWQEILDLDLEVEGFKMYAEFFDGVQLSNNALASICRYRLSTGPYFEYKVYTGQVSKIIS